VVGAFDWAIGRADWRRNDIDVGSDGRRSAGLFLSYRGAAIADRRDLLDRLVSAASRHVVSNQRAAFIGYNVEHGANS
jgi:hypothetical protein